MKFERFILVKQNGILVLFFLFAIGTFVVSMMNTPKATAVNDPLPEIVNSPAGSDYGNCRYGAASFRAVDNDFLSQLGVGWIVDFDGNINRNVPDTVEYVPIIRLEQARNAQGARIDDYEVKNYTLSDDPGGLGYVVTNNPGYLWLIGNEVDRVFWQDDMMPDVYAKAYHDLYHYIKQRDPSAEIAISGLVEVTPGRLQYLDIVWDSYIERYGTTMPVDVWNMHVYILPEIKDNGQGSNAAVALGTDPALAKLESTITVNGGSGHYNCSRDDVYCFAEHDNMPIFIEQIRAMRQWMKDHGQQQKPLILSEWSLLYPYIPEASSCFLMDEFGGCFTPTRVTNFMLNSLNYLRTAADPNLGYAADDNRLVQQWLWYAMNDGGYAGECETCEGTPNALTDSKFNPTTLTQLGNTYSDQIGNESLFANLKTLDTYGMEIGDTGDGELKLRLLNNGSHWVDQPYTVTFYQDAQLTNAIDSVTISSDVLKGCAREIHEVTVVWPGLSDGLHYYWAEIDSGLDSNRSDNVMQGFVIIGADNTFLPSVTR